MLGSPKTNRINNVRFTIFLKTDLNIVNLTSII